MIGDSSLDFRINPDSDPDVDPPAECQEYRPVTVWEMLIDLNLLKNSLFRNGEESGKVIRNSYPGPDHHQKYM